MKKRRNGGKVKLVSDVETTFQKMAEENLPENYEIV